MPKYNPVDSLAPMRLFKQILILQSIYYVVGTALIAFTLIINGEQFSLKTVFSWQPIRFDTTLGWTLSLLWLLDTFFSVLAMTFIVGRSKLALDFTLTLHGINVLVVWVVAGEFPTSLMWWCLQGLSVILMVSLGTWTSQWRELSVTFFDIERNGGSGNGGSYEMVPTSNTTIIPPSPSPPLSQSLSTPHSPSLPYEPPASSPPHTTIVTSAPSSPLQTIENSPTSPTRK